MFQTLPYNCCGKLGLNWYIHNSVTEREKKMNTIGFVLTLVGSSISFLGLIILVLSFKKKSKDYGLMLVDLALLLVLLGSDIVGLSYALLEDINLAIIICSLTTACILWLLPKFGEKRKIVRLEKENVKLSGGK